jgi:hypothetical protein
MGVLQVILPCPLKQKIKLPQQINHAAALFYLREKATPVDYP